MDERRVATRRTDVKIVIHQCIVSELGKETWLNATARDISVLGVSLLVSDSVDSGDSIYLLATITPQGKDPRDLEVNGVAAHCQVEDGQWRVGVKFIDLMGEERAEWAKFLDL
jgi:hypothetical protein